MIREFKKNLSLAIRALAHPGYIRAVSSSYLVLAVLMLVQVSLVPLYLASFGQYQFGVLSILLSFMNIAVIGIAWMSGGSSRLLGTYASRGDPESFARAYGLIKSIYVAYATAVAVLLGIAALAFGNRLFSGGGPADKTAARIALALTGVFLIISYSNSVDRLALVAHKRQGQANLSQLVSTLAFAAFVIPWVMKGGGLAGVLICQICGALVGLIATRRLLSKNIPNLRMYLPSRADKPLLDQLGGKTGGGFFLHGALILGMQGDVAVVGWLGGAKAAAEFYLVWKIAEVLVQLLWKVPESLGPYFVHMDARGDTNAMLHIAQKGYFLLGAMSFVVGLMYAIGGQTLVSWWVGSRHVPENHLAYVLAGAAIFWLGTSRLPVILASACAMLRPMNVAGIIELGGKLLITVVLFPWLGYVALLLGLNLVHALGVSVLYFRLVKPRTVLAT